MTSSMMQKKPSNCKCEGKGFKDKGHRWRVINRRHGASSQLKCLECGWKWWSKCKYVDKLEDHQERRRHGLTDRGILKRILSGTLWVTPDTEIKSCFNGVITTLTKLTRTSNGSTYRFVSVCHLGRKKKIAVHRLVWMYYHRKLVPDGYDVDHVNGKDIPNPDGIGNLQLLPSSVNRSNKAGDLDESF